VARHRPEARITAVAGPGGGLRADASEAAFEMGQGTLARLTRLWNAATCGERREPGHRAFDGAARPDLAVTLDRQ
jgi:hypothetical protein